MNTDCLKCKFPMPEPPKPSGRSALDLVKMTITGYRCENCGHWNDLKRRKPKAKDERPPCGWWASGEYINICRKCGEHFIGDKRAGHCADCAYADSPNRADMPHSKSRTCEICNGTGLSLLAELGGEKQYETCSCRGDR